MKMVNCIAFTLFICMVILAWHNKVAQLHCQFAMGWVILYPPNATLPRLEFQKRVRTKVPFPNLNIQKGDEHKKNIFKAICIGAKYKILDYNFLFFVGERLTTKQESNFYHECKIIWSLAKIISTHMFHG